MQQVAISKNNLFFYFFLFSYVFGVLLYDYINFSSTDELLAFFLVLFAGMIIYERRSLRGVLPLLVMGGIFLFYTIYSFAIHSNVPQAILKDLVVQIKPFLGFYCVYLLAPVLSQKQKRFLAVFCLIVGGLLLIIGLTDHIFTIFSHPSRFATAAIATALLFLYCSTYSWSDMIVFIILLSIGFFSTRSKFYGFWGISVFLIVYFKAGGQLKFNLKSILVLSCIGLIGSWLAWRKIDLYYIDGMMSAREMWSRPAMMLTSVQIVIDYLPFGSGLASFGTYFSGEYYSPTYAEYGINHLWGISKETKFFICDAFYPELAQFGLVGIGLYFFFWFLIIREAVRKGKHMQRLVIIPFLIFIFFLIEGIADATFTHNRGFFVLMILGMILSEQTDINDTNEVISNE